MSGRDWEKIKEHSKRPWSKYPIGGRKKKKKYTCDKCLKDNKENK